MINSLMKMKKVLTTICLLAICSFGYAGDKGLTYLNIHYSSAKISQNSTRTNPDLNNKFGAGFTIGHTYYLHQEPVADLFRFGLDATWFDINYNNFKFDYTHYKDGNDTANLHQGEVSMHVGPSVTFTPVELLNIKAYFRYAPSFACIYNTMDEEFSAGFANMFVGGLSVNYGVIGLGIEARFGSSKQHEYTIEKVYKEYRYESNSEKVSTSLSGFRAFVSINF